MKGGSPRRHEFLVGGPSLDISFPLSMFMGLDGLLGGKPETKLIMRQKTTGIKIRQGSHVSDWETKEEI